MKYLIVSDIHGNLESIEYIDKIANNFDVLVVLGDTIYPEYQNREKISNILNKYKDKIIYIEGNCDSPEDIKNFEFETHRSYTIYLKGKEILLTHGHITNEFNVPSNINILIYGHLHVPFIRKIKDLISINAGSISKPRNDTKRSYITIDEEYINILDIESNIINQYKY